MAENRDKELNPTNKTDRIPYTEAMRLLIKRLPDTTPAELACWILMGREDGGLTAYCIPNELPKPKTKPKQSAAEKKEADELEKHEREGTEFSYAIYALTDNIDYIAPLMRCWFYQKDIINFLPEKRFITCAALRGRWEKQPHIQLEDFIQAMVYEDRLFDYHPISGGTKWSNEDNLPDKEGAMFLLSEIQDIEKVYFVGDNLPETSKAEWLPELKEKKKRRRDAQVEMILQQVLLFKYNPKSIPYGGKNKILNECLNNANLFTESGFGHAWREANRRGLIEVENIDSYRSKPA